jgi:hypothetical protein
VAISQTQIACASRAERLFKTREERKADAPKATAEYYSATEAARPYA